MKELNSGFPFKPGQFDDVVGAGHARDIAEL